MTLRITDKLFEKLFHRLRELELGKKTNELTDLLKSFFEFKCKITYPFIQSESKVKLRSLNQNERLKFFFN